MSGVEAQDEIVPKNSNDFTILDTKYVRGSTKVVATYADLNGIPADRRTAGMTAWVQAGNGSMYQLKPSPWAFSGADWKTVPSAVRQRFNLLSGSASTPFTALTKLVVGAIYYEPTALVPAGERTLFAFFTTILETVGVGAEANVDLYDLSTPGQVSGSVQTTSAVGLTRQTTDVSATLGANTASRLIEARLWITAASQGNFVSCKAAFVDLILI